MNMFVFIPVLFICANSQCEFQQALTHLDTMEECVVEVETRRAFIMNSARLIGQSMEVDGTCVTVRIPTII